jgi:hypothetical protein
MERRNATRRTVDRRAHILIPGGQSIPCRILEMSATGAKLRPSWKGSLPDAFELQDGFSGARRAVTVVRRGFNEIGVRFREVNGPRTVFGQKR